MASVFAVQITRLLKAVEFTLLTDRDWPIRGIQRRLGRLRCRASCLQRRERVLTFKVPGGNVADNCSFETGHMTTDIFQT